MLRCKDMYMLNVLKLLLVISCFHVYYYEGLYSHQGIQANRRWVGLFLASHIRQVWFAFKTRVTAFCGLFQLERKRSRLGPYTGYKQHMKKYFFKNEHWHIRSSIRHVKWDTNPSSRSHQLPQKCERYGSFYWNYIWRTKVLIWKPLWYL